MNTCTTISPLPPKNVQNMKFDVGSYVTSKPLNGEFQKGAPKNGGEGEDFFLHEASHNRLCPQFCTLRSDGGKHQPISLDE